MTLKKGQCPFLKNLWTRTGFKDIPTQTPGVRFPDVETQLFFFSACPSPRGSVPRPRSFSVYASIAQLAEHLLRKEKVTSSILVGGWATGSHGLVGYDAHLTRERSRVRASVRIICLSFCFCFILSASSRRRKHKKKANIGYTMIYGLFGGRGCKKCTDLRHPRFPHGPPLQY